MLSFRCAFSILFLFQIDIIGAVVIVWRVRGETIRSVLWNIVCNNCAQCNAHTYEQT